MRRLTEGTPEFPAEVGLREARRARDLRDVERLAVARVDKVFRAQQVPRRVRRNHRSAPPSSDIVRSNVSLDIGASCLGCLRVRLRGAALLIAVADVLERWWLRKCGADHLSHSPLRRSPSRAASYAICSNVTAQPSPVGDCAANPIDVSPPVSSAKCRMKLQLLPSVEA